MKKLLALFVIVVIVLAILSIFQAFEGVEYATFIWLGIGVFLFLTRNKSIL